MRIEPAKTGRVTFIMLRYMRRPIMVLIAVYTISMVGWILIPGVGVNGNPEQLSLFHAFYFLTYTVTTTGFGELPHAFTEGQRMWGIVSLYAGVVAWFYVLGSIVGLVQNVDFQQSLAERRFAKRVRRIADPFIIICGFGNTGALLTRGLSDCGMTVIVVEQDVERIKGIGPTLKDKLYGLGITSFQQIADFTPADIARVNAVLDFPGRIEREQWVEQAKAIVQG